MDTSFSKPENGICIPWLASWLKLLKEFLLEDVVCSMIVVR